MVSFARARTRSWLLKIWPVSVQPIKNERAVFKESTEFLEKQKQQNKSFLKAIKNGGMWFS